MHRQSRVNGRRAQTSQQSNTCSDSLSRCSEVNQMKFPLGSKFTGFCFWVHFRSSNTCFHLFCLSMDISSKCYPQQRPHCFWTWKTTQKFVFYPLSTLQKHLQHLQSFHIIFSQFQAKFDVWTLFFQVCHFVGLSKLQREQHTLVLNKTLLNSHTCYHLIPSRKWTWQILLYLYLAVHSSTVTLH